METRFKLTTQNYRYLFENASDAMWVHDMEGNIVDANKACEKLTGYTPEELIGMTVTKFLVSGEYLDLAREVRRRLLAGEDIAQPYELQLLRRDGAIRVVTIATSPLIIDGKVRGFQHVARDITEERQLRENMRFYVQQVTRAQEDERKRIARELHDDVSPSLLLLVQRLDALVLNSRPRSSKSLTEGLEDLHHQIIKALEGLRHCAQDLRPRILDDLGLVAALEWMTEEMVKNYRIDAHVEVIGIERSLPDEEQLVLFRIVQEALSNTRRHAEASRAWVTLEFGDDKTTLTVKDNGKGFELPPRIGDLASTGKLGLAGMQERAQLINGKLTLKSQPGKGTTVTVEVPS